MNSFKRVRAFKIENLEVLVFEEKGKPDYPEKKLSEQVKGGTNNKLNPRMVSTRGFEPGPHWWRRVLLPLRHPACSC